MDVLHEVFSEKQPEQEPLPCVKAVEERDGVLIVRLRGKVGTSMAEAGANGEKQLTPAADASERSVIMDFAGTRDIDFTTVALLVQALRARVPSHARVGIIHAPAKLRSEIQIAKLQGMLPIFASEDAAVKALASR